MFVIADSIMGLRERLFEDVVEDFSEVDVVREKFEAWKTKYGETYREAYIGLCLPKLFNPFIRLYLLDWNPLKVIIIHISSNKTGFQRLKGI